jgi:NADH:ubiquinone oxidoreductase subunit E
MDTLKEHLRIDSGETTPDHLFTVKSTRCIGACGLAPIMVVNGNVHGNASSGDILK